MTESFVLLISLMASQGLSVHSVPGFRSQAQCAAAGSIARTEFLRDKEARQWLEMKYACVKQSGNQ